MTQGQGNQKCRIGRSDLQTDLRGGSQNQSTETSGKFVRSNGKKILLLMVVLTTIHFY